MSKGNACGKWQLSLVNLACVGVLTLGLSACSAKPPEPPPWPENSSLQYGNHWLATGDYQRALRSFGLAERAFQLDDNRAGLLLSSLQIAETYVRIERANDAALYWQQAMQLQQELVRSPHTTLPTVMLQQTQQRLQLLRVQIGVVYTSEPRGFITAAAQSLDMQSFTAPLQDLQQLMSDSQLQQLGQASSHNAYQLGLLQLRSELAWQRYQQAVTAEPGVTGASELAQWQQQAEQWSALFFATAQSNHTRLGEATDRRAIFALNKDNQLSPANAAMFYARALRSQAQVQPERAEPMLEEALAIYRQQHHRPSLAATLEALARNAWANEKPDVAQDYANRAASIYLFVGNMNGFNRLQAMP